MTASLQNIPKNSNVYRFITSGKPGYCKLCDAEVQKLESHHTCYEPETTIKLCHNCHHKVHFWPARLNDTEKEKLLMTRFERKTVVLLLKNKILTPLTLSKLIAPSRSAHVLKHQELEIKRIAPKKQDSIRVMIRKSIIPEHNKVYKDVKLKKSVNEVG